MQQQEEKEKRNKKKSHIEKLGTNKLDVNDLLQVQVESKLHLRDVVEFV